MLKLIKLIVIALDHILRIVRSRISYSQRHLLLQGSFVFFFYMHSSLVSTLKLSNQSMC